jgi:hypothetical protein
VFLYPPLPVASEGFYGPLRQIHGAPKLPKIGVPARFFGGEREPLVRIAWADRLGEYFSDYSFSAAEGAGHFVHYERPEAANREIVGFFSSLEATGKAWSTKLSKSAGSTSKTSGVRGAPAPPLTLIHPSA